MCYFCRGKRDAPLIKAGQIEAWATRRFGRLVRSVYPRGNPRMHLYSREKAPPHRFAETRGSEGSPRGLQGRAVHLPYRLMNPEPPLLKPTGHLGENKSSILWIPPPTALGALPCVRERTMLAARMNPADPEMHIPGGHLFYKRL